MSGKSSTNKGDEYERDIVAHENALGIPARRNKRGNTTGDIVTVPALVQEAKNARTLKLGQWLDQTMMERRLARADYGVLIVKRARKSNVGEHFFIMTVDEGLRLLVAAGVLEAVDGPG